MSEMNQTHSSDDVTELKTLGAGSTAYKMEGPSVSILETFPNQGDGDYLIVLDQPEYTSLCPKTGQPDFGHITVDYVPDKVCVETKSFKLYIVSYRNHRSFMETIVNDMKRHLVEVLDPKYLRVTGKFNPRGGTYNTVQAVHVRPDYDKKVVKMLAICETKVSVL